ncbi:MAG: hypothetical protein WCH43_03485 [Verrucomicrobiota bacterium]
MSATKTIHVVITHLEPRAAAGFLSFLAQLSPGTRILCAYGGKPENFETLEWPDKFFVSDDSLRGPVRHQSYNEILTKALAQTAGNGSADYYYFSEYDHFPLKKNYLTELEALMASSQSGLMGHSLFYANHTNWSHYLRYRDDRPFHDLLAGITCRGASKALYSMLANGFMMTKDALESFCAIPNHLKVYTEIYLPSVIYHLGFKVQKINALTNLYDFVRYEPAYSFEEVTGLIREGKTFCHPVKCVDRYPDLYRAVLERAGL